MLFKLFIKKIFIIFFILFFYINCFGSNIISNYKETDTIPMYFLSNAYLNLVKEINIKTKSNIITFGHYEQDNILDNGKEPIEWIILEKDEENRIATLVSKYLLDCKPFSKSDTFTPWEFSYIRSWLNTEFIHNAFTEDEILVLHDGIVKNNPNLYNNIPSGYDTIDKVYILSIEEILNYFVEIDGNIIQKKDFALQKNYLATAKATEYAKKNGLRVLNRPSDINHGNGNYFLRTLTGIENRIWYGNVYATNYVSYITEFGQIDIKGTCIISCDDGIRPVIRIKY